MGIVVEEDDLKEIFVLEEGEAQVALVSASGQECLSRMLFLSSPARPNDLFLKWRRGLVTFGNMSPLRLCGVTARPGMRR